MIFGKKKDKIQDGDKCEKSPTGDGLCCCNCRHQLKVMKHPWNKSRRLKGKISDETGIFVCAVQIDVDNERVAIASERKHGGCELHSPYKTKKS